MIPFLKSVARAYTQHYDDLSQFMFVFPSKRAGTFFSKYLIEESNEPAFILPEIIPISQLIERLSGLTEDSKIDQLFTLYECYCRLLREKGKIVPSFDSFYGWGETAISDFNEVDMAGVNPDEIFRNLKDFKNLSANYLTEEQLEVMEKYFGYSPLAHPIESFWNNMDENSELSGRFLELWRIMAPLYHLFHENLEKRGLTTTGGLYKAAVANVNEKGDEILPQIKKIVFVGFNALSVSEVRIFKGLRKLRSYAGPFGDEPFADFVWDGTGPILDNKDNPAGEFLRRNRKNFPQPEWIADYIKLSDRDSLPESLHVISSPSGVAQAKIASVELSELGNRISREEFENANVAVVLPDENLLLPMMYSFPEDIGNVNLTMGYSLKFTSVISFIHLLRRLQTTSWGEGADLRYYAPDLRLMLAHPFCRTVGGNEDCNAIAAHLTKYHKNSLSIKELCQLSAETGDLLQPLEKDAEPRRVIEFIRRALDKVAIALSVAQRAEIKESLDTANIDVCMRALDILSEVLSEYNVKMSSGTLFMLADRMMGNVKVHFEGEPLNGLQVMGLLETRALDFDYLYILSVNEGVIPRRQRHRSFLPNSIRSGYGMSPANYQETLFSYYFYRMISRAKEVVMIYDGRNASYRTGDVSRYVLQLKHLYAHDSLKREERSFRIHTNKVEAPDIQKDDRIMDYLHGFIEADSDNKKNLSASSLQDYLHCPVKFFLKKIAGVPEEKDTSGFIDIMTQGSIVHEVLERCYVTKEESGRFFSKPKIITKEYLESLIADTPKIMKLMQHAINRLHFNKKDDELDAPLTKDTEIVAGILVSQVIGVLEYDLGLAPFKLYGCEIKKYVKLELEGLPAFNTICIIDRVDEVEIDGKPMIRVVDYKTGSARLQASSFDDVFAGEHKAKHIFQLQFYANLMEGLLVDKGTPVRTEIYEVEKIKKQKVRIPEIADKEGNRVEVNNHLEIQEDFRNNLSLKLAELMDKDKPFTRCAVENCVYCDYRYLCRR